MTDLKRLADEIDAYQRGVGIRDEYLTETITLLRSAAAETVGTDELRLALAAARKERDEARDKLSETQGFCLDWKNKNAALQRAIDEAIIFVEGHLTDENRRKLLAATLRPHATPSQPERVVTVTEPTTEAVRKMTYTSQPERAKDQPASRPCDCRELVARLALVVRDQIAGYINHDAVPDLDAIILDARGGS